MTSPAATEAMPAPEDVLAQEDVLTKIYRDLTRLAGEVAVDRCRTRVLMRIVKEQMGMEDAELDAMFRAEIDANLQGFVSGITAPMLAEFGGAPVEVGGGGCCGGGCAAE